jgi:hypothetical protein
MGKMVLTVPGMAAEVELGFIRDRQRVWIEGSEGKKGVCKGRPATLHSQADGGHDRGGQGGDRDCS